jgi:hypothetical protein
MVIVTLSMTVCLCMLFGSMANNCFISGGAVGVRRW